MNKTLTLYLLLALLLLVINLPVKAQGMMYYVDPSGSNSSGDGSPGSPWQTIQHAAAQVQPGDSVLINPGTYAGGIVVETSGTAGEPISFRANGAGVIIEGSGGERDAFFIDRADYIIVEGLTIQNAERAGMRISQSQHVSVRRAPSPTTVPGGCSPISVTTPWLRTARLTGRSKSTASTSATPATTPPSGATSCTTTTAAVCT